MSLMQILSQTNQNQSQQRPPAPSASSSSSSSQVPPPAVLPPPPGLSPAQFILHSSLPLVGCTKTPPSLLHSSVGGGCAQTPPSIMPVVLSGVTGGSGDTGWDSESKDPDKVKMMLILMMVSGIVSFHFVQIVRLFIHTQKFQYLHMIHITYGSNHIIEDVDEYMQVYYINESELNRLWSLLCPDCNW